MSEKPEKKPNQVSVGHMAEGRRTLLAATGLPELGPTAKLLLLWFYELHRFQTFDHPGHKAWANLLAVSRQSIWRAEEELVAANLIEFDPDSPENKKLRCLPIRELPEPAMIDYDLVAKYRHDDSKPRARARKASPPPSKPRQHRTRKAAATAKKSEESTATVTSDHSEATAKKPPVEQKAKRRRAPLTTDEGNWIRASLENMTAYLLFGLRGPLQPGVEPEPEELNWRRFFTTENGQQNLNLDRWTTQAFMGFYWFRVSKYRVEHGVQLTLPVGFGRTGKSIQSLHRSIGPVALFNLINVLTDHFDLVKYLFGGRYGNTLSLDETTLDRAEVRGVVQQIHDMGQENRTAYYEQLRQAEQVNG